MPRDRKQPKRRKSFSLEYKADRIVLYFSVIMAIFGAIMIFDASVYQATTVFNDQFYFLKQQLIWLLIATIPAILIYLWDYKKFSKLALPTLLVIILLLVAVLIFGEARNGAKRWLTIGPVDIQPAEFAKVVLIIYLSSWLSKREYTYKNFKTAIQEGFLKNFISFAAIFATIAFLVVLEPDLGTTIIITVTSFLMFLMAGEDKTHTLGSIGLAILMVPLFTLAAILEPYRLERIKTYLTLLFTGEVADPRGSGYQIQQILIGIGSGGLLGKGFGQSRQRFGYLVENTAFTDSIFAVILEELGLIGGVVLILGWLLFLWRGLKIAMNTTDKQGRLLASGITIWLVLQALMNMAANVGLIPLTGIPIPFLTYGGSSTIVTVIGIAILLNVSKYSEIRNGR
jgi:cell division protein FtsW